jgi:uncharacterized protein YbjT (DUF2867 family)
MSTERVFITGATGFIGTQTVRKLVESGVSTTAFVRDEEKARKMFEKEINSGLLKFVVGSFNNVESFSSTIKGHSRMLMLVTDMEKFAEIKDKFGKIAFDSGVKQIVDISSYTVNWNKTGLISRAHTEGEEALSKLVSETGKNVVFLRPGNFMTNFLHNPTIKSMSKIFGCGDAHLRSTLIDPRDIGDVAAAIFMDPVEKYGTTVIDVHPEVRDKEEICQIFSKVLGRKITYEKVSAEQRYNSLIQHHMSHLMAWEYIGFDLQDFAKPTPQITILTKKPTRTFEDWVKENRAVFK